MIGKSLIVATALLLAGTSGHAQTVKGQAESWGLQNEELAVLEGKVVDILCEVAGDCPQNCGGGARQLGILSSQGKLTPVSKNGQTAFTGAIVDLLPLCNKTVELDGLFAGDGKRKLFLTQFLREKGAANWDQGGRLDARMEGQEPAGQRRSRRMVLSGSAHPARDRGKRPSRPRRRGRQGLCQIGILNHA